MKKESKTAMGFIGVEENALMDFQFALLDAMKEKGISQVELAGRLGVTRARVSQLLSSEANPTIKLVGRALSVLDLKTDYCPVKKSEIKRPVMAGKSGSDRGFAMMACQVREATRAWGRSTGPANENYAECLEYVAA
ncbi:helix-turn-helix transcriptional regulator [Mesorhizobium sp. WSM3224]|uniref:helix-turn-helix domain-containing protein n=1 Tax=Mesorhizobium sp. WSM3224 TaxID=1040986 RepID=UPI000413842F|nr:helix-turn-helix transcriptional regulator [Mesorhizobium sp. WSM3224]